MGLLNWIDVQLHDESIFPSEYDKDFPSNFKKVCSKIYSRMFRVFVHVYIHHFDRLQELGQDQGLNAEANVNDCFKHFYYFVKEYQLIEEKDYEPLKALIGKICK